MNFMREEYGKRWFVFAPMCEKRGRDHGSQHVDEAAVTYLTQTGHRKEQHENPWY